MKIAVVLTRIPFPLMKGDKLRAYYQIKELAKQHEVYLFRSNGFGSGDKIPFILAVFIVDDNHNASLAEGLQGLLNGTELPFFLVRVLFHK